MRDYQIQYSNELPVYQNISEGFSSTFKNL